MATVANHGTQAHAMPVYNGVDEESARAAVPQNRNLTRAANPRNGQKVNGDTGTDYDDIPENMYRPEKHELDPRWIHRDKLAKIESEELQAAGINLANARSRSTSRMKSGRSVSSNDTDRRDEMRQRLQSPVQIIDDEDDQASWDLRLPEEIEEEASSQASASHMYANPVLRKSGSKIPVLTSSPLPIPAERYERDTPVPRKRTASGSISIEGDIGFPKTKYTPVTMAATDESDIASSVVDSSTTNSPQKHVRQRSKSINLATPPVTVVKKGMANKRNVSGPTSPPNQRPSTRSGEQDKEKNRISFHAAPEGDPPWLATMYKPDPMLPPDQQLIPTLAKKQMQAQWAAEGAMPKAYDPHFNPIDVQTQAEREKELARQKATSPLPTDKADFNTFDLKPLKRLSIHSMSNRPGTSGSITAGYSTMPQITSPPMRQQSPKIGGPDATTPGRSTTLPPPTRMQETSLANEDEDSKKGCACCVVM